MVCVRKGKMIILFYLLVHFAEFVTKVGAESVKIKPKYKHRVCALLVGLLFIYFSCTNIH